MTCSSTANVCGISFIDMIGQFLNPHLARREAHPGSGCLVCSACKTAGGYWTEMLAFSLAPSGTLRVHQALPQDSIRFYDKYCFAGHRPWRDARRMGGPVAGTSRNHTDPSHGLPRIGLASYILSGVDPRCCRRVSDAFPSLSVQRNGINTSEDPRLLRLTRGSLLITLLSPRSL